MRKENFYITTENIYDSKTSKDIRTAEDTTQNSKDETNVANSETSKYSDHVSTHLSSEFNDESTLTTTIHIFSSSSIKESKNAEISSLETTQSNNAGSSTHTTQISMTGIFSKLFNQFRLILKNQFKLFGEKKTLKPQKIQQLPQLIQIKN